MALGFKLTGLRQNSILKKNEDLMVDDIRNLYNALDTGDSGGEFLPFIQVTKPELDVLVTTSQLVVGSKYKVTGVNVNLYGGTDIFVHAILPNKISETGAGIFYTPKYDQTVQGYNIWSKYMNGTFSNIVGTFSPNEIVTAQNGATAIYLTDGFLQYISGDWSDAVEIGGGSGTCEVSNFISPSYNVGDKTHWGGMTWENVNGLIGENIDKYNLDAEWQVIPFDNVEYNVYVDEIKYDYVNDVIISRKDRYNNEVSGNNQIFTIFQSPDGYGFGNPIKDFQWGNIKDDFNTNIDGFPVGVQANKIINSYFDCLNSLAQSITANELNSISFIVQNVFDNSIEITENIMLNSNMHNNIVGNQSDIRRNILTYGCDIQRNILTNNCFISENTLSSNTYISRNALSDGSYLGINDLKTGSYLDSNTLINASYILKNVLVDNSQISNNLAKEGFLEKNTLIDNSGINTNVLTNNSAIKHNDLNNNYIIINNLNFSNFVFNNIILSGVITKCFADGFNEKILTIDITTASILYTSQVTKKLFDRLDGTPKMSYVDNKDITVIGDVTM